MKIFLYVCSLIVITPITLSAAYAPIKDYHVDWTDETALSLAGPEWNKSIGKVIKPSISVQQKKQSAQTDQADAQAIQKEEQALSLIIAAATIEHGPKKSKSTSVEMAGIATISAADRNAQAAKDLESRQQQQANEILNVGATIKASQKPDAYKSND